MASTSITWIQNSLSGFHGPPMTRPHYFLTSLQDAYLLIISQESKTIPALDLSVSYVFLLIQNTPHVGEVSEHPHLI